MRFEDLLRARVSGHVRLLETLLYLAVAALLIVAAVIALFDAILRLWHSPAGGVAALDQLLLVLMLVELLHTVRISIRTHKLLMVPFLIVGLIASIRRVLVITMQAARLTEQGQVYAGAHIQEFHNSMIELGVLAILILVFVLSIARLHTLSPAEDGASE